MSVSIDEMLSQLTIEQKIGQLVMAMAKQAAENDALRAQLPPPDPPKEPTP